MKTIQSIITAAGLLVAMSTAKPLQPTTNTDITEGLALEPRQSGSTQNANRQCADMTIVFARGTTEAGNVGTIAGPPFFDAVKQQATGMTVAVQGIEYPADVAGFLAGGDAGGSREMANQVTKFMTACPNTKVVMAGYSQGGQLVHNAAAMLPAAAAAKVSSAVIFGDPLNGEAVQGVSAARTMVICHRGDNICQGGNLVLAPHLTYGRDADAAASFAVAQAKRGGAA